MPTLSTDFQIGVDTIWLQVSQNFTGSLRVYVSSIRGFVTPVTLTASVLPVDASVDPNIAPADVTTAPWAGTITFGSGTLTPPDYTSVTVIPGTTGGTIDSQHPPTYQVTIIADDGSGKQSNASFTVVVQASEADYGLGITFNDSNVSIVDTDSDLTDDSDGGVLSYTCQEKVIFVPNDGGIYRANDTYWVFYATDNSGYPTSTSTLPNSDAHGIGFYFKTSIDGVTWSKPFRIWTAFPGNAHGSYVSAWYDHASDTMYIAGLSPLIGIAVAFGRPRTDTNGNYTISFDGTHNPQSSQTANGPTSSRNVWDAPFIHGRSVGNEIIVLFETIDSLNPATANHYLETWLTTNGGTTWTNIEPVGGLHPFAAGQNIYGRFEVINNGGDYFVEIYGGDNNPISFLEQTNNPPTSGWTASGLNTTKNYDFKTGKTVGRVDTIHCTFVQVLTSYVEDFKITVSPNAIGTENLVDSAFASALTYESGTNPNAVLDTFVSAYNPIQVSQSTNSGSIWSGLTQIYSDENHIVPNSINSFGNEEATLATNAIPVAWSETTTVPGNEIIKFVLVEMSLFPNLGVTGHLNVVHASPNESLVIPFFFYPVGESTNGHTFPNGIKITASVPSFTGQPFDNSGGHTGSFVLKDDQGNTTGWVVDGTAPHVVYPTSGFTREALSRPTYINMTIDNNSALKGTKWLISIEGADSTDGNINVFGAIALQID